jgi:hypothetical protein
LRESPELAVDIIMAELIRLYKEDFIACCSDREAAVNPLPGYD